MTECGVSKMIREEDFDHFDQTLPGGTDVTFMSQDDCVQLNTLQ